MLNNRAFIQTWIQAYVYHYCDNFDFSGELVYSQDLTFPIDTHTEKKWSPKLSSRLNGTNGSQQNIMNGIFYSTERSDSSNDRNSLLQSSKISKT
jgi:hypothetical protein